MEKVTAAAVQATPVFLDREATVAKACRLLAEAAGQGAELGVLPETFVALYPSNAWAGSAVAFDGHDELWERLWASAIDV
ncbi:MAG TPA: nitrilase-related carbon-nitrogen hydrolase, partial [Actinomycetota bacterium]|nr:nitrilase-related carbon-nitrogen hydrolase [Actinomycetota bacterium]